jgi:hypothetical protein
MLNVVCCPGLNTSSGVEVNGFTDSSQNLRLMACPLKQASEMVQLRTAPT